jgi:Leucine-rich repeat (LRR) protein
MGSSASAMDSDDVKVLNGCVGRMVSTIEEEEACARLCGPLLQVKVDTSSAKELKQYRAELHEVVSAYLGIMNGNSGKAPSTGEQLAAAQIASGRVNLSSADRDDEEKVGAMVAFQISDRLSAVPACCWSPGLTRLSVKKNRLKELPSAIGKCVALAELDVSENELSVLPGELCALPALVKLNVSENMLAALPTEFGRLTTLTCLIAFKNALSTLPESIGQCAALEEVNFFNNKLTKVPDSISGWLALQDLNLGGNKLKTLPSTRRWAGIERLSLTWNNIVMLPDFGGMRKLRQLQMGRNQLSELPDDALAGCTVLESLDLSTNRLERLPKSIADCVALNNMDLSSNQLTSLPDLSAFKSMVILKLSSNKLTDVSTCGLGNCMSLETLFLNDNQLTELPKQLEDLRSLSRINITKNDKLSKQGPLIELLEKRCKANKGKWIS